MCGMGLGLEERPNKNSLHLIQTAKRWAIGFS